MANEIKVDRGSSEWFSSRISEIQQEGYLCALQPLYGALPVQGCVVHDYDLSFAMQEIGEAWNNAFTADRQSLENIQASFGELEDALVCEFSNLGVC